MKLTELNPVLKGTLADGWLHFDCPICGTNHQVAMHVSVQPFHERAPRAGEHPNRNGTVKVWQASGTFPDSLTLTPSIDIQEGIKNEDDEIIGWKTSCWHGHITNGAIT